MREIARSLQIKNFLSFLRQKIEKIFFENSKRKMDNKVNILRLMATKKTIQNGVLTSRHLLERKAYQSCCMGQKYAQDGQNCLL